MPKNGLQPATWIHLIEREPFLLVSHAQLIPSSPSGVEGGSYVYLHSGTACSSGWVGGSSSPHYSYLRSGTVMLSTRIFIPGGSFSPPPPGPVYTGRLGGGGWLEERERKKLHLHRPPPGSSQGHYRLHHGWIARPRPWLALSRVTTPTFEFSLTHHYPPWPCQVKKGIYMSHTA
jgi:hypothetical protein